METDTPKARARLLKSVKIAATFDRLFVDGDRLSTASTGVKRRRRARALTVHTDVPLHVSERIQSVISECRKQRMETERAQHTAIADNKRLCSDASLAAMTKFTDNLPLAPYGRMLHFVPRIVNVVTLAEAIPLRNRNTRLPLDLQHISLRCNGVFYAPNKFAAVQLAYDSPRCRILVFHTGRIVGTGTNGPIAARLALARAQRQLANQADVHISIQNFKIINIVGAVSLGAEIDCESFANAHRDNSHFDASSFVGLAWRPANEACCIEIYSTGRANLPGATTEFELLASFYRMLPELLRFSDASRLVECIPEHVRKIHRAETHGEKLGRPPRLTIDDALQIAFSHSGICNVEIDRLLQRV